MKWAGQISRMEKMGNVYKFSVGKPGEEKPFGS
jgi:hypothetical protein